MGKATKRIQKSGLWSLAQHYLLCEMSTDADVVENVGQLEPVVGR